MAVNIAISIYSIITMFRHIFVLEKQKKLCSWLSGLGQLFFSQKITKWIWNILPLFVLNTCNTTFFRMFESSCKIACFTLLFLSFSLFATCAQLIYLPLVTWVFWILGHSSMLQLLNYSYNLLSSSLINAKI